MRADALLRMAFATLLLVAGAGPAPAQISGRVSGTIKDEAGQPIKGATVTADFLSSTDLPAGTAPTDDKGRFSMVGLRFGEWEFKFSAPGFMPQRVTSNIRVVGVNPPITMTLARVYEPPSALGGV